MAHDLPDEIKGQVLIALNKKGVEPGCPMCRCPKWVYGGIETPIAHAVYGEEPRTRDSRSRSSR